MTIERPEGWPIADAVRIVTPQPDLDRLAAGRVEPGERIRLFVSEKRFASFPTDYTPFDGRLTVAAEVPASAQIPARFENLRKHRAELMFSPATIGDGSPARQAADAGVPVRLEFDTEYEEAVLSGLLDHFLHSASLQVPIEPFYSLAAGIGRRRRPTLWQVFDGMPGRCLFVDAARRVSLSKWWAQQGAFLGSVHDGPAAWHNSDLWKDLVAFADRVFISQTPCAFCEHYPYCGGIWRAASDSETPCLIWQRLMDRMVEAYRSCPTTA